MADRSSGRVTVAELMARMGENNAPRDDKAPSTAQNKQPVQEKTAERVTESDYVPRRLRDATPEQESSPQRSSGFSWNDIVQDADWSAADKLESWPYREEPATAGHPIEQVPEVDERPQPRRDSGKSVSAASLLDTYSSDRPRPRGTTAAYYDDDYRSPYTAGMEVLDPDEVAQTMAAARSRGDDDASTVPASFASPMGKADAREDGADVESASADDGVDAADTSEDAGAGHKVRQFFQRVRHSLTRDTSDENLAMATRVLQVAQVAITAVVGGLLFWGFGILWSKPGLGAVTFVLALLVQIIMVVVARVLRRKEEFWVLILTFVVAFFVTVGPLILPH